MELVLSSLAALGLAVVVLFAVSLRGSLARDRAEVEAARRNACEDAETARRSAARNAELSRKGARLRCLGCDTKFRGPLGPEGCPECRLESLVVTDAEYRARKKE